jgi:tetratricopeptide (TPR) repeat protein
MAQRLNKRFLIILTLSVAVFAALGVAAKLLWHRDPMNYAAAGDTAARNGKWDEAIGDYQRALSLGRGDPDLYVRLGNAQEHRVGANVGLLKAAVTSYENALVVDPGNLPASRHLLELYVGLIEVSPGAGNYTKLRDAAARVARLDPSDQRAKAYQKVGAILLDDGSASGAEAVAKDFDELAAMVRKDPSDANLPYYYAQAKLRLAATMKTNDPDGAIRLVHDAAALFDDALSRQPDQATLNWRGSQIYTLCSRLDSESSPACLQKAAAALDHARRLTTPADPHFADIEIAAALAAAAGQQPDDAEKILRALLAAEPNNAAAELQFAGFLAHFRHQRDQAIDVLSKPIVADDSIGPQALLTPRHEQDRLYQLTRYQAQAYEAGTDPVARQKLLSQIDDNYKKLFSLVGERDSASLLQLKALIQEIKGDPIAALATYQQALSVMDHADVTDTDLIYHAAMIAAREGQSGEAEKLLLRIVSLDPAFAAPQLGLADIYLRENAPEKAQPFIDAAEKLQPGSPAVIELRIRQLVAQNQPDAAHTQYASLPEADAAGQLAKARSALIVGDAADAQRLLEPLQKQSPDDATIGNMLARAYVGNHHPDLAQSMVAAGLAKNPKSLWLLMLRQRLRIAGGASGEAIDPDILNATDEFTREFVAAENEFRAGNFDAAATHLAAADRAKADDVHVHELYFEIYLAQHRYDLAGQQIPALAALHADGADGLIYRVRLLLAKGEIANAVQASRDLVKSRPDFAQSYAILGTALVSSGQSDKAVAEFKNALDRQPGNLDGLLGLIDAYTHLNQPERIAGAIASAQKLYPNSEAIREKAIEFDLAYSDHPEAAIEERQTLLDAHPDEPSAYAALAQAALRTSERDQTSHPDIAAKALQQASDTLNKAVARWPKNVPIVGLLSQLRRNQGDLPGAEKLLLDLAAAPELASSPDPSLLLFDFYQRVGKTDSAISALHDAFEKSNHSVMVELKLAGALVSARRFDEAMKMLQDQNNSDRSIQRLRMETLVAAGRTDDAEREIKSALQASPRSIDLLNLLTGMYIGAGRYSDARPVAKEAMAVDSSNNDALYHQAVTELHLADCDTDLALRDAMRLKLQNPANALAYGVLADAYYRLHHPDDALTALEEGLKAVPEDRNARLRLLAGYSATTPPDWTHFDQVVQAAENDPRLRADPIWLINDAKGLAARKQFDPAIEKVDQAIALAPNDYAWVSEKLSILMEAGKYQVVIDAADQLLASGHKQWWVYLARGSAEYHIDKAQGEKDLDAALAAADNPDASARVIGVIASTLGVQQAIDRARAHDGDPHWRLMTGDLLVKKGDFHGAVQEITPLRENRALAQAQRIHALTILAESYSLLHQPQNAKDLYLEVIGLAPNDPVLLNNLADVLADDLNEPMAALQYSQRAYDLVRSSGQEQASISDTQGWVLTLCGGPNASAGREILQKVVEDHQDFPDARYHLGEALLRSSMPADAVKQLEIAQMQLQRIEEQHGSVDPQLKSAIAASLAKARQLLSGNPDAAGK